MTLVSFVLWIAQWALLVAALWLGRVWAWNVTVFMLWLMLAISLLAAADVATKKKGYERPMWRSVVSAFSDLGVCLVLAAFGHFFYASLVVIQQLLEWSIFHFPEEKKEEF